MRQVRCHWLTWGKPLAAGRPDGAVVPGSEHGVTRRSAGFPEPLEAFCTMASLVGQSLGASAAVDPANGRNGAFVYRPVICAAGNFCLFARIRSLPELGRRGAGGRFYSHLSFLALPLRDWSPEVVPAMYRALFDDGYGQPDREGDAGRIGCPQPVVPVGPSETSPAIWQDVGFLLSQSERPVLLVSADTMQAGVKGLAHVLAASRLARGVQAALPWSFGLDPKASGTGSGFVARSAPAGSPALRGGGEAVLEQALRPSPWVSFADCLGVEGEPCWGALPRVPADRPLAGAAVAVSELAREFDLPPPWNAVGFSDFLLDVTGNGESIREQWPELYKFWPDISALTRFGTGETGICQEILAALPEEPSQLIKNAVVPNDVLNMAIEVWCRLDDVLKARAPAEAMQRR